MAISRVRNVRISGIASAVPNLEGDPADFFDRFGEGEVKKIIQSTGVYKRRVVPPGMCASDLCMAAAEGLFGQEKWQKNDIDAVIFLSQSGDYVVPFTAALLQKRLGLATSCAAFDVNLGCSGYVYGLWMAASLIAGGGMGKVLLLMGDTSTTGVSADDRATALLFGDAGTATILERTDCPDAELVFVLGTDGNGGHNLIVPAGGSRNPSSPETRLKRETEDGSRRSDEDLYMNGPEIFAFTLREVPKMVSQVLAVSGNSVDSVDSFVFHQANKFILDYLARRMRLPADKVPLSIGEYGNTSAASIPVTLTHCLRQQISANKMKLLLAGFGVGYSWGAVICDMENVVMPEMIFLRQSQNN